MLFCLTQFSSSPVYLIVTLHAECCDKTVMRLQAIPLSILLPVRMGGDRRPDPSTQLTVEFTHGLEEFVAPVHYCLTVTTGLMSVPFSSDQSFFQIALRTLPSPCMIAYLVFAISSSVKA